MSFNFQYLLLIMEKNSCRLILFYCLVNFSYVSHSQIVDYAQGAPWEGPAALHPKIKT